MPTKKNKPHEFIDIYNSTANNKRATNSIIPLLEANTSLRPYNPKKKSVKSKAVQRQKEADNHLKELTSQYKDSIKVANPTIQQLVGEQMKQPLRYLGNPLRIVGDIVGGDIFPNTNQQRINDRLGKSGLNEIPEHLFNSIMLTINPAGTMAGHTIGVVDNAVSNTINTALGTKLGTNPAEIANNVVSRKLIPDYKLTETAGGVRDINQAIDALKNKNYLDAGVNTIFGLSGLVEIPDNLKQVPIFRTVNTIDNAVEGVKNLSNAYDLVGGQEGIKDITNKITDKQFANGGNLNKITNNNMIKKTNKKSFAQRAKEITNRYKRAKFDKIEREELDAALAALAQEQEAYKQANGIGEYSPENIQAQQMEGMQQFPWGGNLSQAVNPNAFAPIGIPKNYGIPVTGGAPQTTLGSIQGILPSLLGGAASMVGNMIMSAGTKPIELKSSYTPEQISLARQRERLSREAGTAQNVAMRGLRESGNRGAYLSGVGNVATGVNRSLSDSLTQSYMSEETANLEQRNKAQDYQKQVDMANWQARQQAANDKRAYQSAAISTIPSVMTDINRIQGQNALLESLGSQNYMIAPSTNKAWKDKLLGRTLYGTVRK